MKKGSLCGLPRAEVSHEKAAEGGKKTRKGERDKKGKDGKEGSEISLRPGCLYQRVSVTAWFTVCVIIKGSEHQH